MMQLDLFSQGLNQDCQVLMHLAYQWAEPLSEIAILLWIFWRKPNLIFRFVLHDIQRGVFMVSTVIVYILKYMGFFLLNVFCFLAKCKTNSYVLSDKIWLLKILVFSQKPKSSTTRFKIPLNIFSSAFQTQEFVNLTFSCSTSLYIKYLEVTIHQTKKQFGSDISNTINGIRWPSFCYSHQHYTVLIN